MNCNSHVPGAEERCILHFPLMRLIKPGVEGHTVDLKFNAELKCTSCVRQILWVDLRLRIASCVLQDTTARRVGWPSQVACVQRATTVLRDRSRTDRGSICAQRDNFARR